jgi:hypothetical protein
MGVHGDTRGVSAYMISHTHKNTPHFKNEWNFEGSYRVLISVMNGSAPGGLFGVP